MANTVRITVNCLPPPFHPHFSSLIETKLFIILNQKRFKIFLLYIFKLFIEPLHQKLNQFIRKKRIYECEIMSLFSSYPIIEQFVSWTRISNKIWCGWRKKTQFSNSESVETVWIKKYNTSNHIDVFAFSVLKCP